MYIKDMIDNISYIGLMLDNSSRELLNHLAAKIIEKEGITEYKLFCHHMTVAFRTQINENNYDELMHLVGQNYNLTVTDFGLSDKACAVKVRTNCPSMNAMKHVTLFTVGEGKPKDSNDITEWTDCSEYRITLSGTVGIVKRNKN